MLFHALFNVVDKSLSRLERRNVVSRDDDGGVLGDVTTSLLSALFDDEAAE